MRVADYRVLGLLPLRDHRDLKPEERACVTAGLIESRDDFGAYVIAGHGTSEADVKTFADLQGAFHIPSGGADKRAMGSWMFSCMAVSTSAYRAREDKGQSSVSPGGSAGRGFSFNLPPDEEPIEPDSGGLVSWVPVINRAWGDDNRYAPDSAGVHPDVPDFPKGTPLIVMAATKENEQHLVAVPINTGQLLAPNKAGNPDLGTYVYDLTAEDEPDKDRRARLQTFWRVVRLAGGCSSGTNDALAWQLSQSGNIGDPTPGLDGGGLVVDWAGAPSSGQGERPPSPDQAAQVGGDDVFQVGSVTLVSDFLQAQADRLRQARSGNGGGATGDSQTADPFSSTPGGGTGIGGGGDQIVPPPPDLGDDPLVVASITARMGGFLEVGDPQDVHRIGQTHDGQPVNAAHLSTQALWKDSVGDGPLDFEVYAYEEPTLHGPFQTPVHLRWDGGTSHSWACGSAQGKWRWTAESFFMLPGTADPPPKGGRAIRVHDLSGGGGSRPRNPPPQPWPPGGHPPQHPPAPPQEGDRFIPQPFAVPFDQHLQHLQGESGGGSAGNGTEDGSADCQVSGDGTDGIVPLSGGGTNPSGPPSVGIGLPLQPSGGSDPSGRRSAQKSGIPPWIDVYDGSSALSFSVPGGPEGTGYGSRDLPAQTVSALQSRGVIDASGRDISSSPPMVGDSIATVRSRTGGLDDVVPTMVQTVNFAGGVRYQAHATADGQVDLTSGGNVSAHAGLVASGCPVGATVAFADTNGTGAWDDMSAADGTVALSGGIITAPPQFTRPSNLRLLLDGTFVPGEAQTRDDTPTSVPHYYPGGLSSLVFGHPSDGANTVTGGGAVELTHNTAGLGFQPYTGSGVPSATSYSFTQSEFIAHGGANVRITGDTTPALLDFQLTNASGTTDVPAGRLDASWNVSTAGAEDSTLAAYAATNGALVKMLQLVGQSSFVRATTTDNGTGLIGGFISDFETADATGIKTNMVSIVERTTGASSNGLGSRHLFQLTNSASSTHDAAALDVDWVDATAASEDSQITLYRYAAGAETKAMRLGSLVSLFDSADQTKVATLDMSGITTGTTRAFAFPDKAGTLALTSDISGSGDVSTVQTEYDTGTVSSKTWTIPAGTLSANGEWLRFTGSGRTAGGGGGTCKLTVAGTVVKTSASLVSKDVSWEVLLVRTSNTGMLINYRMLEDGGAFTATTASVAATNLTTTAETIVITANSNYIGVLTSGPDA